MTISKAVRKIVYYLPRRFYAIPRTEKIDSLSYLGFELTVPPTVFHPALYFSSKMLAQFIRTLRLGETSALDLGCGSGIISLVSASMGASVTATDINPVAVETCRANAIRNGLGGKIEALQGNLYASIPEEREFDFIFVNPPFYDGDPSDAADHAWRGGEHLGYFTRLAADTGGFLSPRGKLYYVISSDSDTESIEKLFKDQDFTVRKVATKRLLLETLYINEVSRIS